MAKAALREAKRAKPKANAAPTECNAAMCYTNAAPFETNAASLDTNVAYHDTNAASLEANVASPDTNAIVAGAGRASLSVFANVVANELYAGVEQVIDAWFAAWAEPDEALRRSGSCPAFAWCGTVPYVNAREWCSPTGQ